MSSKYKITETNAETGVTVERDANAAELAQFEADEIAQKQEIAEATVKAADKAALLSKLGITADEAKLFLG
jgi:hypothetical protein